MISRDRIGNLLLVLSGMLLCGALSPTDLAQVRPNAGPDAKSAALSGTSGTNTADEQKSSPSAQTATTPSLKLSDFAWLEGRWRGEWGPRVAEQVWLAPKAGVMTGVFNLVETEKTLVIEMFTLVEKPAGIRLYLRHFTPELANWEKNGPTVLNLATGDGKSFTFENVVDGKPKRTTFTRIDNDTYVSRSEIVPETGDVQIVEITYKCVQHATQIAGSTSSKGHKKS